jgi:tetratricopeptide (TPR) repeat protein
MRQAAERVYEQTQPYRYAVYLQNRGQSLPAGPERQALLDRSRAIMTALLSSPSETERLWGSNGLTARLDTSARDSVPLLETALEIDAEHPVLLFNLMRIQGQLGFEEAAFRGAQRTAASMSDPRNRAKVSAGLQVFFILRNKAVLADLRGDWLQALEFRTRAASEESSQPLWLNIARDRVDTLTALHQPSAALALNDRLLLDGLSNTQRTANRPLYLPQAEAAASLDQWPQALAALEAFEAEVAPTLPPRSSAARMTYLWPRLAYARARTGDLAGAQALIAATPPDCYLCVRERARIAELAGDRAGADRWSAEARRQGPSLPFAFAERGQMLMARGDTAGAIDFYEQAIERGPRWADPQKYWGDALMAQGDEAGAIRKYRAAAERAPRWGALHLAWGRALEAQGRLEQAREKYEQASRMDLSVADRAEVVRRLGAIPARS